MKQINDPRDPRYQRLRKQKAAQKARMKKKSESHGNERSIKLFEDAISMIVSETEKRLSPAKKRAFQKDLVIALRNLKRTQKDEAAET